jgi:hypothetical protein
MKNWKLIALFLVSSLLCIDTLFLLNLSLLISLPVSVLLGFIIIAVQRKIKNLVIALLSGEWKRTKFIRQRQKESLQGY